MPETNCIEFVFVKSDMFFSIPFHRSNSGRSGENTEVRGGGDRPAEAQSAVSHAIQQVHPRVPPSLRQTVQGV